MPRRLEAFVLDLFRRSLAGDATDDDHSTTMGDDDHGDGHSEIGVHITYQDLYGTVVFLVAIYVSGELARRVFRMPSLVGEIFCGILLGPPLVEGFVPYPEAWVMFGELGCVLLPHLYYANDAVEWRPSSYLLTHSLIVIFCHDYYYYYYYSFPVLYCL